jgi:choline-phosphate cytidylyltransferase
MKTNIRIYVDGVFDLTHYGHFALFKKIKQIYPTSILLVGVSSDEDCTRNKTKTILTHDERIKSLSYCKYIDNIINDIPWIVDEEFVKKNSIDYICHDPLPYLHKDTDDIYKIWKNKGMFIGLNRTEGISTSDIINRIKKQHQM